MKHTEVALRRPVTTIVVFVALSLVGLIASRLLPLEKFPDNAGTRHSTETMTGSRANRCVARPIDESSIGLVDDFASHHRECDVGVQNLLFWNFEQITR